jgi:hypothetical protein
MTYEEFNKFRDDFLHRAGSLSARKSEEYTISNLDKLYNFKHVAARLGITSEQALMTYVLKHVDAICNDAKTGSIVSDETVESRAMDICNYMILYAALKHIPQDTHENDTEHSGAIVSDSSGDAQAAPEHTKWNQLQQKA